MVCMAALNTSYPGIAPATGKRKSPYESIQSRQDDIITAQPLKHSKIRHRTRNNEQSSSSVARSQGRKHTSAIESLPHEIISNIFLESSNPNLLNASKILAYQLQDEYTMKLFGARLFCDTQTEYDVRRRMTEDDWLGFVMVHPNPDLQAQRNLVLSWEWITLDLFQKIRWEVCNKKLADCRSLPDYGYLVRSSFHSCNKQCYARGSTERITSVSLANLGEIESNIDVSGSSQLPLLCTRQANSSKYDAVVTRLDVDLKGCHIPRRLLGSPVSREQIEFLILLLKLGATVMPGTYDAELLQTTWLSILDSGYILDALYLAKDMRIYLGALCNQPGNEYLLVKHCPLTKDGWTAFKAMFNGSTETTFRLRSKDSEDSAIYTYRVRYNPKIMAAAHKYLDAMLMATPELKREIWNLRDILHDYK